MPRTKISEFSATPANNTDIDSINIAEGCAPSGINDAIRELMAQLKDFQTGAVGDSFNGPVGSTTAGTGAFTTLSASGTATLSGLTASTALALDASKNIVSVTNTGTGSNVLATSPTLVTPALGTPSSGVVTNLTGTASININGTVGATTATTGAFTTLAASSTVTLSGGTANGVAYLNGSKVVTSGSALTFNGSTFGVNFSSASNYKFYVSRGGTAGELVAFTDGTAQTLTIDTAASSILLNSANGGALAFGVTTEQMRLTSTGLGIGTSSPSAKLTVANSGTGIPIIRLSGFNDSNNSNYSVIQFYNEDASGQGPNIAASIKALTTSNGNGSGGQIAFSTSTGAGTAGVEASETMRLDGSGNLGLGVTPSDWVSVKAIQYINGAAWGIGTTDSGLSHNAYFSGGWKYISSSAASTLYAMSTGAHAWSVAPSGTAGNAITFTQAMTLDASGNLGVGTTSPSYRLDVKGAVGADATIRIVSNNSNDYSSKLFFGDNVSTRGSIIYDHYVNSLTFWTNSTERARIDTSGNFGIGTSSPAVRLDVNKGSEGEYLRAGGDDTGNNGRALRFTSSTNAGFIGAKHTLNAPSAGGSIAFATTSTERLVIDSSGNLGLGVTPSAWATLKAIEIAGAGNTVSGNGTSALFLSNNAYFNSSWKYANSSAAASQINISGGGMAFNIAASGTAGNAITFTQAMTLDASGNLRIGTTAALFSANERVSINGATGEIGQTIYANGTSSIGLLLFNSVATGATSGKQISFVNSSGTEVGSVTSNGSATLYNTTSDQRLKENIQDAESSSSLIDAIQVRQFDWKSDGSHQRYGFVAQELVTVAPEAVHQPADADEMMSVDYSKLVPMLVKEIQSLRKRLADAGI